jgi:hypothetical protein
MYIIQSASSLFALLLTLASPTILSKAHERPLAAVRTVNAVLFYRGYERLGSAFELIGVSHLAQRLHDRRFVKRNLMNFIFGSKIF